MALDDTPNTPNADTIGVDGTAVLQDILSRVAKMAQIMEKQLVQYIHQGFQGNFQRPSQPTPTPNNKPTSLPWFQNGVQGLVNKVVHGDSHNNPDWKRYEAFQIESVINEELNKLFEDQMIPVEEAIKAMIKEFVRHVSAVVYQGLKKLKDSTPSQPPGTTTPKPVPKPDAPKVNIPSDSEMMRRHDNFLLKTGLSIRSEVYKGMTQEQKRIEQIKIKRYLEKINAVFDPATRWFTNTEEAMEIMADNQLNPSDPTQVRTLWPGALHKPLAEKPPKPKRVRAEGTLNLDSWPETKAEQLVEQILEDTKPATKLRYLKYKLAHGL